MRKSTFEALREFDTEWVVLLVFIGISGYMFWAAGEYSSASAEFPRITGGMVIVFGLVVVASKVFGFTLPGEESTRLGSAEELDEVQDQNETETDEEPQTLEEYIDDVRTLMILTLLVVVYTAAILTLGLIISSFVFILLYTVVWKRMKWYEVVVLVGFTAVILWMFQTQLNIELNQTFFDTGVRGFIEDFMEWLPLFVSNTIGETALQVRKPLWRL